VECSAWPPGGEVLETQGTYSYQRGSNKLTNINAATPINFGYDPNGNITSENTRTLVCDLSNQLIQVWNGGTQIAAYTYNGVGQRMMKVTQTGTRIFHYDLSGHLIAETNQSGQVLGEYIYLGGQLLAMIRPGEVAYYFHNDHLGTPQVLTNDSQSIAWKAAYTPFGEAVASIQTVENPFRFPGQYYDQETGLHYNYFRYYNPQTGRYLTPDPIGLEGGINLFSYVKGNPVNKIDRLGLSEAKNNPNGSKRDAACQNENKCNKGWVDCYTNCINTLVPFDAFKTFVFSNMIANMGFYLSGGVTSIVVAGETVVIYEAPIVLTGAAGATAGIIGEAGLAVAVGTAGWVAGSSYGCMISCGIDKCSY
jgi:RHS repeat-associated protein